MSFELGILLQRIVLPAICSLLGCYLLSRVDKGEDWYDDQPTKGIGWQTFFGATICAIGMIGSDLWQRGVLFQPVEWSNWQASYQWQWMVWMIPGFMILLALVRVIYSTPIHFTAMAATATTAFAIGVLFVCLNEGKAWEDQSTKLMPWMAASCLAVTLNTASLNSIARSDGSRWVALTTLGQFGCVAAIALQSYASLGEWTLVGLGVSIGAAVVGGLAGSSAKLHFGWQLSTVVVPLGVMAVACCSISNFFESQPLPLWLVGSVLFLPTIVCVFDVVFGRLFNAWFRVVIAAIVCSFVLGAILNITKPWQSEW